MKFKYTDIAVDPSDAFPTRTSTKMPLIRINIEHKGNDVDILALVDSGADFCIFPGDLGRGLGIDVESGKMAKTIGVGNTVTTLYFHDIIISVGGHKKSIYAGFTDDVPVSLLGNAGFFDNFDVRLDYLKDKIKITPY